MMRTLTICTLADGLKIAYNRIFRRREMDAIIDYAECRYLDGKYQATIRAEHPGFMTLASEIASTFKKFEGINYVETSLFDPAEMVEYAVIIQRKDKLTPAQVSGQLRIALERIASITDDTDRIARDAVLECREIAITVLVEAGYR